VTSSVKARFIAERIEGRSRSSAVAVADADESRSSAATVTKEEGGGDDGFVTAHLAIMIAKRMKITGQTTHSHTVAAQSVASAGWLT
jgi:hypothetical protein